MNIIKVCTELKKVFTELNKNIHQQFNEIFICKTMFHPLRDPQLQLKSENIS